MALPSLEFLCDSLVAILLDYYGIDQPPVPIRDILRSPPPDLTGDLSLVEGLPFNDALWIRLPNGQGKVFANLDISEHERRYAMARSLFTGLCYTKGGRAAGLPYAPNDNLNAQATFFARRLLIPDDLLPPDWQAMPLGELAALFVVPEWLVEDRLQELVAG
ncbi:MAG: hypothetical protein AAB217_13840 [Chloroflexota bacterium]|mgnify:FL=1